MSTEKKKLAVLTGAGISAESGFRTFRGSDGMWEEHRIEDVASIEGWYRDPKLMVEFYNGLRAQLAAAKPNRAHEILAELEADFDVRVITQNVDDLHERAGSTNVIHLHGELTKVRSVANESLIKDIGFARMEYGDRAEDGQLLRPHIVWFGEAVPMISEASRIVRSADIFAVVGSSLVVYPAAGLLNDLRGSTPAFLIDPNDVSVPSFVKVEVIKECASKGMEILRDKLMKLL